ncbi:MAG TPA: electron transfer flavoprotein subunit alpha/FixB family protein [Tenuifilaceae bacterium]|nr:electron transfer flavoprotein subunit alpha/FixB family protein [Tenuifilaceae bacterium]HOZ13357.1 electron transfer flavoprotein subunit alpha/FixB family protein [Tenuifilaceae bacterium]HPI45162.1 electron transfer flavoprotein subunit alpha/FixB family protein [Tenuifilaceae bacterium]HPN22009.1 electron transfer flavoprotein subunit alpha/FixB family protein [Tenuifilaceae bacterium]HPV57000.1 electron transfer flavoprotein subunit alpha/FixB family protein [Tenuifilaceae bacterium]
MSVLVYTENWDGKFKKSSFELVSYASKVAEMMGTSAVAVSIGNVDEAELKQLGNYGAQKVISVNQDSLKTLDSQAYTSVIATVAEKIGAKVIVVANNNSGKSIAPRLSVKLKAALGAGVSKLPVSTSPFTVYKRAFSGGAYADVVLKTDVKVITLAQNSFDIIETAKNATIEKMDVSVDAPKTQVKEVQKQSGKLLLTDAEIVVSGGRGMKSADNWSPIIELADLLGAATACSRPVSDEGWRPHDEHTGQTGKIIAPNLYFAVGISGATQHIAGVSSSKYIVAINNDKSAPIFEVAQYGIVGDAQKVLPQLVAAVKEIKGK